MADNDIDLLYILILPKLPFKALLECSFFLQKYFL